MAVTSLKIGHFYPDFAQKRKIHGRNCFTESFTEKGSKHQGSFVKSGRVVTSESDMPYPKDNPKRDFGTREVNFAKFQKRHYRLVFRVKLRGCANFCPIGLVESKRQAKM